MGQWDEPRLWCPERIPPVGWFMAGSLPAHSLRAKLSEPRGETGRAKSLMGLQMAAWTLGLPEKKESWKSPHEVGRRYVQVGIRRVYLCLFLRTGPSKMGGAPLVSLF